ncbi:MAG: ATP-dependent RecD-like DNA helicase, partial [Desulfovibrio sp.]|nr:ATP-dependent RecD-like DNA helicase [Desulfovibrio sp.]
MATRTGPSLPGFSPSLTLHGTLERVVFHNEDNGFTVLRLKVQGRADPVTVVGEMPSPQPGVRLSVTGAWSNDPRFGRQFRMESCEILLPATLEGIRHYLGSGLIKGVGPALAGRIVDAFGERTFDILDEKADRLASVKGISSRMIGDIKAAWAEHKGIRELILFLQPHGISTSYAVRIFRHYGADAVAVVRENPYRLAMDIRGIGFLTADALAVKLGISHDAALRLEAGLLHILSQSVDEGHCFVPRAALIRRAAETLEVEEERLGAALEALILDERIVVEDLEEEGGSSFQAVYLRRFYLYESSIAYYLHRLLRSPKSVLFDNPEELLGKVRGMLPIDLAEGQVEAALAAMTGKVLVITGGPGTGKT